MLEVVGERLFSPAFQADHFVFDFVERVLVALQGDLGQDRLCARVLLGNEVTRHGPKIDEGLAPLVWLLHAWHQSNQSLKTNHLLCHVRPIETIDAVRPNHPPLYLFNILT